MLGVLGAFVVTAIGIFIWAKRKDKQEHIENNLILDKKIHELEIKLDQTKEDLLKLEELKKEKIELNKSGKEKYEEKKSIERKQKLKDIEQKQKEKERVNDLYK